MKEKIAINRRYRQFQQNIESMQHHNGLIHQLYIENRGSGKDDIGLIKARFVHYPDCQQLTIWLPEYGGQGYGMVRLLQMPDRHPVDVAPVRDRINGSIQILWDSQPFPPGQFLLEIEHPKGGLHILTFEKLASGVVPAPEAAPEIQEPTDKDGPIVYRDGTGKILVEEDMVLRARVQEDLIAKFGRHMEYETLGRSGSATYIEGDRRVKFYFEMGGGNCMGYLDIPSEEKWAAQTPFSLAERADILDFVAKTVQRDQASSCRYEIKDTDITYYYR